MRHCCTCCHLAPSDHNIFTSTVSPREATYVKTVVQCRFISRKLQMIRHFAPLPMKSVGSPDTEIDRTRRWDNRSGSVWLTLRGTAAVDQASIASWLSTTFQWHVDITDEREQPRSVGARLQKLWRWRGRGVRVRCASVWQGRYGSVPASARSRLAVKRPSALRLCPNSTAATCCGLLA